MRANEKGMHIIRRARRGGGGRREDGCLGKSSSSRLRRDLLPFLERSMRERKEKFHSLELTGTV